MTDATVLADKLVEAGIGERHYPNGPSQAYYYAPDCYPHEPDDPDTFITDWRVAGKVLESSTWLQNSAMFKGIGGSVGILNPITPRAIIEAWYAARETEL